LRLPRHSRQINQPPGRAHNPLRACSPSARDGVARWNGLLTSGTSCSASSFGDTQSSSRRGLVGGQDELVTASGRASARLRVLIHYGVGPLQMIGSWSYLDQRKSRSRRFIENRRPRAATLAELVAILESETRGRIGLEANYIGTRDSKTIHFRTLAAGHLVQCAFEIRFALLRLLECGQSHRTRQTHYDPRIARTGGKRSHH